MNDQIEFEGSDSHDSVIVVIDDPGTQKIEPCPPEWRPIMEAIRKKYYETLKEEGPPPEFGPNA